MLKTNREKLPCIALTGKIQEAVESSFYGTWMDQNGYGQYMFGPGGIVYNYKIGDNCMDICGNIITPNVCLDGSGAMKSYSSIGNKVTIVGGKADGEEGIITGKIIQTHSVMAYFPEETLHKMNGQEQFIIEGYGCGLRLTDYPDVYIYNLDPNLLDKMGIEEEENKLVVPVTHIFPSYIMGEGWGNPALNGSQSILTDDKQLYEKYNMGTLRFGDVVLIEDHCTTNGRVYMKGACTLGVISNSDGVGNGVGPGVTTLMSAKSPIITGKIDPNANLATYFGIDQ